MEFGWVVMGWWWGCWIGEGKSGGVGGWRVWKCEGRCSKRGEIWRLLEVGIVKKGVLDARKCDCSMVPVRYLIVR